MVLKSSTGTVSRKRLSSLSNGDSFSTTRGSTSGYSTTTIRIFVRFSSSYEQFTCQVRDFESSTDPEDDDYDEKNQIIYLMILEFSLSSGSVSQVFSEFEDIIFNNNNSSLGISASSVSSSSLKNTSSSAVDSVSKSEYVKPSIAVIYVTPDPQVSVCHNRHHTCMINDYVLRLCAFFP